MAQRRANGCGFGVTAWGWRMAIVVALLLVASGCGRSGGSKPAQPTATSAQSVGTPANGTFGNLPAVCGPGNASGATDVGVTDTSINVSTMADPGATADPGLDQELFDSADAFVAWCNDAGGILGRRLSLHKRDSALFNVGAQMVAACQQPDFMLVGNGEALDATGVQARLSCHLPEIAGYVVSAQAGTSALSVQPDSTPVTESGSEGAYRALARFDPAAIKHFAILNIAVPSVKDAGLRDRAAAESLGYVTRFYQELPVVVTNWRPIVENLRSNGITVFTMENSPDNEAALYKAMADVGYFPKYAILPTNAYDTKFVSQAGAALNGPAGGTYIISAQVPFEQADHNPATKQYIGLLDRYVHGAQPRALGVNGFSAWLLFAESAKACGSNLTRQCVLTHASGMRNWTSGGLHAPSNPGSGEGSGTDCFVLIKASDTGFTLDKAITRPNNGIFNCDPANLTPLKGVAQAS